MAKTKHGLPETKGQFKLRGLVTGMLRDDTYSSKKTKTGNDRRVLKFGVQTAPESTVYVTVQGMEMDNVYFSKRSEVKNQPSEIKKVKWNDRFNDQGGEFKLIGVGVGLDKDENGKNIIYTMTDYDAAKFIYEKLEDETPVFIRGQIEFSHYKNDNDEVIRSKKFVIKNIYNSKNIDFDAEDFKETSDFKQRIIFMGIEKVDDKNDPRFLVDAKVVTYGSVEDVEFVVRDKSLANTLRANLKPYSSIEVWGNIYNKLDSEEIKSEKKSIWGQEDSFKKVNGTYIRELVITGADPESIDKDTYSEEKIDEALRALKEFGENESSSNVWGTENKADENDDLPW